MQSDAKGSPSETNFQINAAASGYHFPEGSFPSEVSRSRDVGANRRAIIDCTERPVSSLVLLV